MKAHVKIVILISVAILQSCISSSPVEQDAAAKAVEQKNQAEQQQAAADRRAIESVINKMSTAEQLSAAMMPKEGKPSAEEARAALDKAYTEWLNIDTSSCPADFRIQYQKAVTAMRKLNEAVANVPADAGEYLVYALKQGVSNSNNPDFDGKQAVAAVNAKYEELKFELTEMKALATRYGVAEEKAKPLVQ